MTSPADPHDQSVAQPVDPSIEKPAAASLPGNGLEYEKIYQSLSDAIFIIKVEEGPTFRYIDSNHYHEQMTGLAREDLRGKTPQEVLPPPLAVTVEKNYRRCWNLKSTIVYEETLSLPKDIRTWQTTLTPIYEAGEVRYIIGSGIDISGQKSVEIAFQEAHEQFESFFSLSPDLLCIANTHGRITKANKAWKFLMGYEPMDLQDTLIFELVHPEDFETSINALNTLNRGESLMGFVIRMRTSAGEYRFIEWNAEPSGSHIFAAARDITERKANEDRLMYLNFHDPLTGLYNRAYFEDALTRMDVPRNMPISVITADLNGLKLVNDTFGHAEGDTLLRMAADVLKKACRADDIIARVGGDEFSLLLPRTDAETANHIIQRIQSLAHVAHTGTVMLSLSLGEATKTAEHHLITHILKDSESAMYHNKLLESRWAKNALIESIASVMESQASRTMEHCRRVQKLSEAFGKRLGLTPERIEDLSLLALMHDIGIMSVPMEIVDKRGPLEIPERVQIQKHSESGYRIAVSSPDFARVAEDILSHHERWDGEGYPRGLSRRNIPLHARIVALIEAYDTMRHDQVYRPRLSKDQIQKELADGAGTQFDPHLTRLFLSEFLVEELTK
jgi:diguanylate cyclase (GGDEF)-like protein/PAS domain S-box-containing protein